MGNVLRLVLCLPHCQVNSVWLFSLTSSGGCSEPALSTSQMQAAATDILLTEFPMLLPWYSLYIHSFTDLVVCEISLLRAYAPRNSNLGRNNQIIIISIILSIYSVPNKEKTRKIWIMIFFPYRAYYIISFLKESVLSLRGKNRPWEQCLCLMQNRPLFQTEIEKKSKNKTPKPTLLSGTHELPDWGASQMLLGLSWNEGGGII